MRADDDNNISTSGGLNFYLKLFIMHIWIANYLL